MPSTQARIRRYGGSALHVELATLHDVLALHAAFSADPPHGLIETVPAVRTLLVSYDPLIATATTMAAAVRDRVAGAGGTAPDRTPAPGSVVEVPVRYDGDDLSDVARLVGSSPQEVVHRHLAGSYLVALIGFAPGFYFVSGGDPVLRVPRRSSPRTAVAAGAIGLAGEFTGIYPRSGPGGWQIIGHTPATLWDRTRTPAALLAPGTPVRFVEAAS